MKTPDMPSSAKLPAPERLQETGFNTPQMRRILASSFIGSAIEFYDFILYATAASLVFNKVFFTNLGGRHRLRPLRRQTGA
jgi:hypothetical protein